MAENGHSRQSGLHRLNRTIIKGLELIGVGVLLAAVAWLLLIVRLSQGPLEVNYLTSKIERELNSQQNGFVVDAGSTILTWGKEGQQLEFEVRDVQVSRDDKTPVLFIDKVGIEVSKRYLVFGQLVPRVIKIYGPALRVIRKEDKSFSLNVASGETYRQSKNIPKGQEGGFIRSLLTSMRDGEAMDVIAGLVQIDIKDADLLYEDKLLDVSWRSKGSNVSFTRKEGGLSVTSVTNMEIDKGKYAFVRGNIFYSWKTSKPNGIFYFTGFNPSVFAQHSEKLAGLSNIDLALKGSTAFEMNEEFKLIHASFILGADEGVLNPAGIYKEPMQVQKLYMKGEMDYSIDEISLKRFELDFKDAKLAVRAKLNQIGKDTLVRVRGSLLGMSMDKLARYWPEGVADDARDWVTANLSKGVATEATLNTAVLALDGNLKNSEIKELNGEIAFEGIEVDYFSPLDKVKKVSGTAQYDHKSFALDIESGDLNGMVVTDAKINITDLDIQSETVDSKIDIKVNVQGPVVTALKVLDSKPLEYPKELGINSEHFKGDADIDLSFKFPLRHDLELDQVDVEVKAKLKEVFAKDIVSGFDLSRAAMDLVVNKRSMLINGKGIFANAPATFDLLNHFSDKSEFKSRLKADLLLKSSVLKEFNISDEFKIDGEFPAKVTYTVFPNDTSRVDLDGDISNVSFFIPVIEYEKAKQMPGAIKAKTYFGKNKRMYKAEGIDLQASDLRIKGRMTMANDGKSVKELTFDHLRAGDTDVSLEFENKPNIGYEFNVKGPVFDASRLLSKRQEPDNYKASDPVSPQIVRLEVDKLITAKERSMENINVFMRSNQWNRIEHLEVDGVSGNEPVKLRYEPKIDGGYTLLFEADNAGAALSALGITNSIRGGKISVKGAPNLKSGPRDLAGRVAISNFTLVRVPALAMLLNAMSLVGIGELLNGKGIAFKKMGAEFLWIDKGQPDTFENVRMIHLKDGKTSGSSLGLTFEGNIDRWNHYFDIDGTIIPASGLSKMVGSIPLVGDLLTGGSGGGVFAATYKIKGDVDKPKVTVNPLSVLAPGVVRKIFFE